ncbi:hypothetical protein G7046_g9584 [Stylonectria norvegica]|nr:hypothetical protein G7046_g9584 [Stylonectria norvegica]
MARRNSEEPVPLLTSEERDRETKTENMDLENDAGRPEPAQDQNLDHEYSIPSTIKFAWLGTYFFFSLLLTLYNKLVLGTFHFPWLLTFLHASFASGGTYAMMHMGYFKLSRLGRRENLALVAFSALFTANIAVSNLSLAMVSVPFFQTMRMLCPIFTILIYRVWYGRTYSTMTYLSLLPLIIGAAMTTMGEMNFTDAGFLLTILGVVLAALKTVVTNRFMTGSLALPPVEFLMRMSPLAALQALACAAASGEVGGFHQLITSGDIALPPAFASLTGNGFLALLLNISSFNTNKLAGALTMTVCGNLKQCLTVALGIIIFNVSIDFLNGAGMGVTMLGAPSTARPSWTTAGRRKLQPPTSRSSRIVSNITPNALFESQDALLHVSQRGIGLQTEGASQDFEIAKCFAGLAEHAEADGDFGDGDEDADDDENDDDPGDVAHLGVGDGVGEDLGEVEEDAAALVEDLDAGVYLEVFADGSVEGMQRGLRVPEEVGYIKDI